MNPLWGFGGRRTNAYGIYPGSAKEGPLRILEDGTYFGSIPGFEGLCANEVSLEACRDLLQEVLEEWLLLSFAKQLGAPGGRFAAMMRQRSYQGLPPRHNERWRVAGQDSKVLHLCLRYQQAVEGDSALASLKLPQDFLR